LHDAWPLNGSYHISPGDYDNSILLLDSYKPDVSGFLERKTLNRKKKYLSEKNISFTVPSNWLLKKYNSSFYNKKKSSCRVIPNFIDLSIWKPLDKKMARKELNIKTSKTLLTFGSSNANTSYNKGFHNLKKILSELSPEKYALIIFGNDNEKNIFEDKFESYNVGRINSSSKMRTIYSAGDITVVPSMSESFSLVSLESIACDTPVLAFKSSGILDIVKHKENGFLSERFNVDSLKEGVHWLTKNKLLNISKSISCFSKSKVVPQFEELYLKEFMNI
jgi:glycosyltransferase involved in cell wall biosynthesis